MLLSKNFLKDYVSIDEDIKTLAEDMTKVGNEYDYCGKLIEATNLIIGEVLTCNPHPDSDHLHVCTVDIGKEKLQIVCGAENVRSNIKVIVAQVGAALPGGKIKESTIRGVKSCGMLCALDELGLDNKFLSEEDKKGIHILPKDAPVGGDPIKYLSLDDEIIDFELTANRGDLLSILGMAYEIGAIYNKKVKDIDLNYKEDKKHINFKLDIDTDNCSLFLVKQITDVVIKESPDFIKSRLIASGIRPINNVVDISNYVMLETGQPLHFYDSDKLGNEIKVRMAKKDEHLKTLDGIDRILNENDIVITDGKKTVGLAGVMGGFDTEITDSTKNITIESAIFDPIKVRLTSKKVLKSEASTRFEKGLDPNRTYMAIERCCHLLEKYANAKILSGLVSYDKTNRKDKTIKITREKITNALGLSIATKDIINIFNRLGLKNEINNDLIIVSVPTRRIDLNIEEDLVEEVGRIYGVDNLVGKLPVLSLKKGNLNKDRRIIRSKLASLGLNEVLTYSLINEKDVKKYTLDSFEPIKVLEPMTEERETLRYSLLPSLVGVYNYNKARNMKDISIFEMGKSFYKTGNNYNEENHLAILMAGKYYDEISNSKNVDFYVIKGIVENLLEYLGYKDRYNILLDGEIPNEFHPTQSAIISIDHHMIGYIGRIHPNESKDPIYLVEINLDKLLEYKVSKIKYKEISKYPIISKDVAFVVSKDETSYDIMTTIKKKGGRNLLKVSVFDVYEGDKLDSNKRSIAYNLKFGSSDHTLTDEEVDKVFRSIISEVVKTYDAILRDN